jgi:FMN phosphatase YigB (HAD superfamily)
LNHYWVFDLDGCLVNTRAAVKEAYRCAGVEMPEDAWGKPVGSWCTPEQHVLKNQYYGDCLARLASPGPAFMLWKSLTGFPRIILTGASHEALRLNLLHYPELMSAHNVQAGLTWLQKRDELLRLGKGFYIDDDREVGEEITKDTWFTFIPAEMLR